MTRLSDDLVQLSGDLAGGSALSSDEFLVVAGNFPALAAEAAERGLADPGDLALVQAVADPDEVDGDLFDALCDRTAALAAAILAARAESVS